MGLLDEAIREHLELKRRRGADPGEITRQESEAFGPVRREAAEAPAAEVSAPAPEPEPFAPEPAAEAYEPEPEPDPEPFAPEPAGAVPFETRSERPAPEPPAYEAPPPAREPDPEPLGQPTAEFAADDVADALGGPAPDPDAVPGEDDEDELAETPEFLQETPEHDRLWFEQKPPKDFDF